MHRTLLPGDGYLCESLHGATTPQSVRGWSLKFANANKRSVEGIPTMAWGILTFFALPGRPEVVAEKGTWLFSSQAERDLIRDRTLAGKKLQPTVSDNEMLTRGKSQELLALNLHTTSGARRSC